MGEVIKYGIIKSPGLFNFLENNYRKILKHDRKALEHIVYECSLIKARVVEKDERDNKNIRVILNLGHTIGHAIETGAAYSGLYSHGQAIALGIISAAVISQKLGLLDKKTFLRIKTLIKKMGLPTRLKRVNVRGILLAQEHDKKFIHGKNRFVLPLRIGKVTVKESIPYSIVKDSVYALL
jgi:3-dehydroquinate synthetase